MNERDVIARLRRIGSTNHSASFGRGILISVSETTAAPQLTFPAQLIRVDPKHVQQPAGTR